MQAQAPIHFVATGPFSHRFTFLATGPSSAMLFCGVRIFLIQIAALAVVCCIALMDDGHTHCWALLQQHAQNQLDPARELKARVGGALHTMRTMIFCAAQHGYAGALVLGPGGRHG